jgi:hypothetical protein
MPGPLNADQPIKEPEDDLLDPVEARRGIFGRRMGGHRDDGLGCGIQRADPATQGQKSSRLCATPRSTSLNCRRQSTMPKNGKPRCKRYAGCRT